MLDLLVQIVWVGEIWWTQWDLNEHFNFNGIVLDLPDQTDHLLKVSDQPRLPREREWLGRL